MSIELNRYKNVDRSDIESAMKFVQGKLEAKDAPSWVKRFKKQDHKFEVKKNNLFIDNLLVVGNDERDTMMRKFVYDKGSLVAPSRDAGYYTIKKKYLNISRRNWVDFLKKQRVIRMTDNAPPAQKKGGRKISRPGELELDLFFISGKDIKNFAKSSYQGKQSVLKSYPVLNIVDRLTSYAWCKKSTSKEADVIGKNIKEGVLFFQNLLKLKKNQIHLYSDDGAEFKRIKKFIPGIDHTIVAVGSKVEQKNSHIQRNFHRFKNAKRGNTINAVLQQAVDVSNNSYNRVLKKTPAEAAAEYSTPEGFKKIKDQYNSKRAKADTDRRKPLKVGDWVRVLMKKDKEGTFYKAYRGTTYTKKDFPVNKQNLKNYPDKALSQESYEIKATRGSNPKQYKILGLFKDPKKAKWFGRHELSEPLPNKGVPDQISEALLKNRNQAGKSKDDKPDPKPKGKAKAKPKPAKPKVVQKHFEYNNVTNARAAFRPFERKLKSTIDRGTITKQKYNSMLKRLEDFVEFFVWHSSHGLKMDKPEARDTRNKSRKLLEKLKKIDII